MQLKETTEFLLAVPAFNFFVELKLGIPPNFYAFIMFLMKLNL